VKAELPGRADFRRWARAALRGDVAAALRIVDAEEGLALNRNYRGKDYATNVLTFEYGPDPENGARTGDIVLCAPVVEKEAKEQGKPLAPITPTSPSTACCTSRATTTKPERRTPLPWRRWKALSCRRWDFPTLSITYERRQ
jgi:hypothetical protein